MNKIIALCLIALSFAIIDNGPSYNPKYPDSEKLCVDYFKNFLFGLMKTTE